MATESLSPEKVMPESLAQSESSMSVGRVRDLVRDMKKRQMEQSLSTLRDIRQEEQGEEIANPDLVEYKKEKGRD